MMYKYVSGLTAQGLDYLQRANGSGDVVIYFGDLIYRLHELDVFVLTGQLGVVITPMHL